MNSGRVPEDLYSAKRDARNRYLRGSRPARRESYVRSRLHSENVTAVGIGRKITAGAKTDDLAVRVYVRSKLPKSVLGRQIVPSHLNGIPTDVIVSGPFRALGTDIDAARLSRRPVAPGVSLGFAHPTRVIAGTLGALVERGGQQYYLSNNHILAFENKLPIGSAILQPGMLDGGKLPAAKVGELAEFVRLVSSGNKVDAALSTISANSLPQPFLHVSLASSAPAPAMVDQQVHKMGRTTGYTTGIIEDIAADIPVIFSTKVYRFEDQILISGNAEPFASEGDSGALVAETSADSAIGMLFAGSNEFAAANHFDEVAATLGVSLVI